jgi:hypothetical protein
MAREAYETAKHVSALLDDRADIPEPTFADRGNNSRSPGRYAELVVDVLDMMPAVFSWICRPFPPDRRAFGASVMVHASGD